MHVQNTAVTRTNDVLGFEDTQIRLERRDSLDRLLRGRYHETGRNILVRNASKSYANVVATKRLLQLLCLFSEDTRYFDCGLEKAFS